MLKTPFPVLPDQLEEDLLQAFKLLSDRTRLRIVLFLATNGEQDVSTLCKILSQSQPLVSHHLALLRIAGIIQMRRDGKHNFYSASSNRFDSIISRLLRSVQPEDGAIRTDEILLSLTTDKGESLELSSEVSTAEMATERIAAEAVVPQ